MARFYNPSYRFVSSLCVAPPDLPKELPGRAGLGPEATVTVWRLPT
jgi:hypothetical protein